MGHKTHFEDLSGICGFYIPSSLTFNALNILTTSNERSKSIIRVLIHSFHEILRCFPSSNIIMVHSEFTKAILIHVTRNNKIITRNNHIVGRIQAIFGGIADFLTIKGCLSIVWFTVAIVLLSKVLKVSSPFISFTVLYIVWKSSRLQHREPAMLVLPKIRATVYLIFPPRRNETL